MADTLANLPAVVLSHSVFFDRLVDLIPPKFYIPSEEVTDTWTFKKNKAARLAAKKTTRENLKKAKRNRLDPDKFKSTVQLLQEKKEAEPEPEPEPEPKPEANADPENGDSVPTKAPVNVDRAVTYDDLRERLHKRIEMMRSKRHAETAAAATLNARSFRNEKKNEALKRRLEKSSAPPPKERAVPKGDNSKEQSAKRQKVAHEKDSEGQAAELEFSRVKMGVENPIRGVDRKGRKESKGGLLKKATELQEMMQDPTQGEGVTTKHSWSAAMSRAAGEKVLDNPKLLKNSIRREKQQKDKSAKKWKERKESEKRASSEKQKTRKENISQRIQATKERSIAKREKKLMRPGFEGRKAGFINS